MTTTSTGGDASQGRPSQHASGSQRREEELQHIREALRDLRFGMVEIVVQDGVVVQINRTEKLRLPHPRCGPKEMPPTA